MTTKITYLKKLVDTCGWIEWLTNGSLADQFEIHLKDLTELVTPTLIQYELYKWICREKDSTLALEVIGVTENSLVIPLDTNLALYSADIAKQHNLAMADAVIYATSRQHNAVLITSDKHFKNLPFVMFIEK